MVHALAEMSGWTLLGLAVMFALAVWLFGSITNMVLRERGFGVILNGVVMVVGFLGGVYIRYLVFGTL
jgi:hypothetical protein